MATFDTSRAGLILLGSPSSPGPTPDTWSFNPTTFNQTYIAFYKMQGWSDSDGWQSWENSTGGEENRPATAGPTQTGTIVANWFLPQGF